MRAYYNGYLVTSGAGKLIAYNLRMTAECWTCRNAAQQLEAECDRYQISANSPACIRCGMCGTRVPEHKCLTSSLRSSKATHGAKIQLATRARPTPSAGVLTNACRQAQTFFVHSLLMVLVVCAIQVPLWRGLLNAAEVVIGCMLLHDQVLPAAHQVLCIAADCNAGSFYLHSCLHIFHSWQCLCCSIAAIR